MKQDENIDLSFEIMIDSESSQEVIFDHILSKLESVSSKGGYLISSGNVLKLGGNALHDKSKTQCKEEGWMYYKFNLTVFPEVPVDLNNQISLVKKLFAILRELSCQAELIAEFEI